MFIKNGYIKDKVIKELNKYSQEELRCILNQWVKRDINAGNLVQRFEETGMSLYNIVLAINAIDHSCPVCYGEQPCYGCNDE